jgi:hypothetical protein
MTWRALLFWPYALDLAAGVGRVSGGGASHTLTRSFTVHSYCTSIPVHTRRILALSYSFLHRLLVLYQYTRTHSPHPLSWPHTRPLSSSTASRFVSFRFRLTLPLSYLEGAQVRPLLELVYEGSKP